jgi:hypothetical protein
MSRLYGNQAGPTKRDAASTDPRSRMIMLGIFHMNAMTRAGSPSGLSVIAQFRRKYCCE